jgi:4-amino-4-deoxy-L-arabinose transferase-like glycosyltransferase
MRKSKPPSGYKVKADRWFYSTAGTLFLVCMLVGFRHFVSNGAAGDGSPVEPARFRLDLIHGLAIATWYSLFLAQSLLISVRNRRLHFKLGWSAVAVALAIVVTGPWAATRSVQNTPSDSYFFGMQYFRFLLVMYAEIALYAGFVAVAIFARKKPPVHRAAMLLAGMSLLAGATSRMPFLYPIFGNTSWAALFGPVFCLGALLLLVRWVLIRSFDRWFALGYAVLIIVLFTSERLSMTETWSTAAMAMLKF